MCFSIFCQTVVTYLESLDEPEKGLDALQLGSLNHAILEETYQTIRDEDLPIHPENTDEAVQILHEVAQDQFISAPLAHKFRASDLWEQEQSILLRRLETTVRKDFARRGYLQVFCIDMVRDNPWC